MARECRWQDTLVFAATAQNRTLPRPHVDDAANRFSRSHYLWLEDESQNVRLTFN